MFLTEDVIGMGCVERRKIVELVVLAVCCGIPIREIQL